MAPWSRLARASLIGAERNRLPTSSARNGGLNGCMLGLPELFYLLIGSADRARAQRAAQVYRRCKFAGATRRNTGSLATSAVNGASRCRCPSEIENIAVRR